MKSSFGGDLATAILASPKYKLINRTSCLSFLYKITGDSIRFYVNVTLADDSMEMVLVQTFVDQNNYPDWSSAYVTIESFTQIVFVADKIGYTEDVYYAFLDDITISDQPCLSGNFKI